MKVSERIDLISRIGRELQSKYTFDELYSYLSAFGVPMLRDGPTNSKWVYVKTALAGQSNELVLSIARDLGLAVDETSPEIPQPKDTSMPYPWGENENFRVFISHIAKDKDKATRLKDELRAHSISGFVAHEDILPTLEWQSEIERALHHMDAMVTVHTHGFSASHWTQQEIGVALGTNTAVIPLRMGEDPVGFLSKIQAISRRGRNAKQIAAEISDLLSADPRTSDRLADAQAKDTARNIEEFEFDEEVAAALKYQFQLDYDAAGEKSNVSEYVYQGVRISSRWAVVSELKTMEVAVSAMSKNTRDQISLIWCDSKAGSVYSVSVKASDLDSFTANEISEAIVRANGGHNSIFFESDSGNLSVNSVDYIGPIWDED